jgi:hypothetical protein
LPSAPAVARVRSTRCSLSTIFAEATLSPFSRARPSFVVISLNPEPLSRLKPTETTTTASRM